MNASTIRPGSMIRHRLIRNATPVKVTRTFPRPDLVEVEFDPGERGIVNMADYLPA